MTRDVWQLEQVRLGPPARLRLTEITLSIPPGITAILGESGAGKTSLLNLLVGFERPDAGTICFQPGNAALPLAWVPVDGGLWPQLTVREHIAGVVRTGDREQETGNGGNDQATAQWLDAFDLNHVAARRPATLSMGERARLSVARALASGAAVQVMDEPLAHVDSARSPKYWSRIRSSVRDCGGCLVFATHAPEIVLREASWVICLEQGRVVWQGAVSELYSHPPDERTAQFLGPVNWLSPTAAEHWMGIATSAPLCLRPEQLQLVPADAGPFQVEQVRFAGSIAEADLRDADTQERRTFYHRPPAPQLSAGLPVALRALLLGLVLLMALATSGCNQSNGHDRPLAVTRSRHFCLPSEGAMLPAPRGMTFGPRDELFILDNAGRMIVYDPDGTVLRQWWMPEYSAGKPEGAWVLLDGRIAVADTHYHRVLFFDQQGAVLGSLGEQGEGPGQFIYTVKVTQDPQGFLYVAEYGGNDRVQKFTAEGQYVLTIGKVGTGPGEFQRASGLVWKEGVVYVADAINNRIHAFKDDGTFLRIIADAETAGLHYPYDMALSPDGTLWLAEYGGNRLTQVSTEGKLIGHYGTAGRGLEHFWTPWGVAVRRDGMVFVADTGNRRVVELQR